jgi:hypothetical protein
MECVSLKPKKNITTQASFSLIPQPFAEKLLYLVHFTTCMGSVNLLQPFAKKTNTVTKFLKLIIFPSKETTKFQPIAVKGFVGRANKLSQMPRNFPIAGKLEKQI